VDLDRIAVLVANMRADEASEVLRTVDLFERIGLFDETTAETWRIAVRARAVELADPVERS